MPNLYGVANPLPSPNYATLIGGTNLNCPTGVETNILQWTNVAGISPGVYYPVVFTSLWYTVGATAPNPLSFNTRVNGGADLSSIGGPINALTANQVSSFNVPLVWPASATLYQGAGATVQVSCTPAGGGSISLHFFGCWGVLFLFRAPDQ